MSTICMLAAMSSSALAYDNRCAGMNKQLDQLSKAVDAACKATKAKDCKKINSDKSKEYQKVASDFVKEWNKVVGNSSLKIGARYFTLGKGGNGTIQSTQRMWVSKGIATKDSVTIKVKELDGKLYVGAHVCVLEPGKSKPVYKKTVYFNKDKKEKGKKNQTYIREMRHNIGPGNRENPPKISKSHPNLRCRKKSHPKNPTQIWGKFYTKVCIMIFGDIYVIVVYCKHLHKIKFTKSCIIRVLAN